MGGLRTGIAGKVKKYHKKGLNGHLGWYFENLASNGHLGWFSNPFYHSNAKEIIYKQSFSFFIHTR
ncbi:hypothetical protein, partial [Neisseria dentiae]|uniref:hypothetical protein n=1 Tax=Neisseria dentiae TaxID=194197 RepID=UPI00359FB2B3